MRRGRRFSTGVARLGLCVWTGSVCVVVCLLLGWAFLIPIPSVKEPVSIYASDLGDDLRLLTLKVVGLARESIQIATYALTDQRVIEQLRRQLQKGVAVDLTYDRTNTSPIEEGPHRLQKGLLTLNRLDESGLMHEKWCVIDRQLTLLGSANLTRSSLAMHGNLMLGVRSSAFAQALLRRQPQIVEEVGGQLLEFYGMPQAHRAALDMLLTQLEQAQHSVQVALFTFTHPLLIGTLIALQERGVSVELFLDRYSAYGASARAIERLRLGGVGVRISQGEALLHHKWACIDHATLILGSANWTQAAFSKNRDFLMKLSPLTPKQQHKMQRLVKRLSDQTKQL